METSFSPRNFILCALSLALACFMQILDSTIANVALPTIAGNLGASTQQSTWVVTSFTVSNAIALPLTGWLARRIGEVRLFVAATALFTLMSFLCGIAPDINLLILFRALQGFFAGPIFPVAQALMIAIFPASKRFQAIVAISIVVVVAPIVGPILGGWITDSYSWPWIFFVNVPVGVFAAYVVWVQMKSRPELTQRPRVDYVGLISLAIGVSALQIMLDMGNDEDWFDSNFIIAAAIIASISMAVFLIWELTEKEPIVDLRIFRHRNFTVGTFSITLYFSIVLAANVLLPIWTQTHLHYTPTWSGLVVAPMGIFPILLMALSGRYGHLFDMRLMASCAFFAMAIPFYLRSTFNLEVDFSYIAYLQLLQGIGMGLYYMPITTIMLSDLKPHEIASGSGLAMFARVLGGSFSVSLCNYLWNSRAILHHSQLAERFAPTNPITTEVIHKVGHDDVRVGLARLDLLVTEQAYQISFNEVFLGFSILMLIVGFSVWLSKPPFIVKTGNNTGEGH